MKIKKSKSTFSIKSRRYSVQLSFFDERNKIRRGGKVNQLKENFGELHLLISLIRFTELIDIHSIPSVLLIQSYQCTMLMEVIFIIFPNIMDGQGNSSLSFKCFSFRASKVFGSISTILFSLLSNSSNSLIRVWHISI